ncbi:hypothetical protein BC629DRAFT_795297 [Irpex lacteus]|nr:hypothetical protein BC629DRAFT_795297 [Irpex lacteus]
MPTLKNVKSGLCMAVHSNTAGRKIFVLQSKLCSWTFNPRFDADKAEQTCTITIGAPAGTTQITQTTQTAQIKVTPNIEAFGQAILTKVVQGVTVLKADPGIGVHANVLTDWASMKDDDSDDVELGFLQLSGDGGKLQTSIVTIIGQWDIQAAEEKEQKKKYVISVYGRSNCVLGTKDDDDAKVVLKQGGDKTDERNQWYIELEETSTSE